MQSVTITRIERKDITTSRGPAKKVGIQTNEHGAKWLGAFVNQYNERSLNALAVGQTVEIIVETSQDGKFLNFKMPSQTDKLASRVTAIEAHLGLGKGLTAAPGPVEDINPDDIPF